MQSPVISKKEKGRTKKIKEVERALETFRQALTDSDEPCLQKILSEDLTYGHSDGFVEGKTAFITGVSIGKYDFVAIRISNQSISIYGKTAIVRHLLDADTNDNNTPGHVSLSILLVWRREKARWRLLSRQAVKVQ